MKIVTGILSVLLIMVGADKFLAFLTPPCSLMTDVPPLLWKFIGVVQILSAILVWNPKFRKNIAWLLLGLMVYFSVRHLAEGTSDIGGAVFLGVICILMIWSPGFLRPKS